MVKSAVKRAAEAHTDLCVFAVVVAVLESGSLYGSHAAAHRIITICNREQQRLLDVYDRAAADAGDPTP